MDDMELEQMQDAVNELLGEESFSLEDALHKILSGEKLFSKAYSYLSCKESAVQQSGG